MAQNQYGNMRFSHAVGYRGLFSIEREESTTASQGQTTTTNDKTVFLCTGGNINLTQDPIMSGGVWGAGYANAAPIAYAFNYLSLEGSANFEWVNRSQSWEAVKKFAFTERTNQTLVNLLPDGANGFHGYGWCSSLSFEASEGAALTGSLNFKGDPSDRRENEDRTDGLPGLQDGETRYGIVSNNDVRNLGLQQPDDWNEQTDGIYVSNNMAKLDANDAVQRIDGQDKNNRLKFGTGGNGTGGTGYQIAGATLIPYWNTKAATQDADATGIQGNYTTIDDIINWSCSYTSDLQVLKCCSYGKHLHYETHTPIGADYILCGEMSGEGSLTIFALREVGACAFSAKGFHKPKKNLVFVLGGFDTSDTDLQGQAKSVLIPNALISSGSTAMATGASYISCDYSFNALGDGVNGVMLMVDGDLTA